MKIFQLIFYIQQKNPATPTPALLIQNKWDLNADLLSLKICLAVLLKNFSIY